jgi:phosphoenolpyruvate-protein kinase (PTS system EI component)
VLLFFFLDEYKNLLGAPKELELNPMLGFHGIRFSLKNPELLRAEIQAIKNVGSIIPMILSIHTFILALIIPRMFER